MIYHGQMKSWLQDARWHLTLGFKVMENSQNFIEAVVQTLTPYGQVELRQLQGVARIQQEHQRPLDHPEQIRVVVWKQGWGSVVQITIHHALMDGFSIVLMVRKFKLLLQGQATPPYPQVRQEPHPSGVFKQPKKQHLMLLKLTEGRKWRPVVAELFGSWLQEHFPRSYWAFGKLAHGRTGRELRSIGVFCKIETPPDAPWVRSILNELPEFDFAVPGTKRILHLWLNPMAEVELQSTLRGDLLYLTFRMDTELCSRAEFEAKALAFRTLLNAQKKPLEQLSQKAMPPAVSLLEAIGHHAEHHPEVLALEGEGFRLSYAELWKQMQAHPDPGPANVDVQVNTVLEALVALHQGKGYNFGPVPVAPHPDLYGVVYTSGTTGPQKPIRLCRAAVQQYLAHLQQEVQIEVGERVMQAHAWTFDGHIENLWLALLNGATLVLPPVQGKFKPDLWENIQHASVPTAVFHMWARSGLFPAGLKTVIVGGEPLQQGALDRKPAHLTLINTYGPAEATISVSVSRDCSLGVPLEASHLQLVQASGEPVQPGEIGEIQLSGPQLSPDVSSPFLTGDLAFEQHGKLWFAGRKEHWVKIRGHRIHLQEIGSELMALPEVHFAQAVQGKDRVKVCFFPPSAAGVLREHTSNWRIPLSLVPLQSLPLGAHGKMDVSNLKAQLPEPAAASPQEALLIQKASEVLDCPVQPLDDLFMLGMDSLDVVELSAAFGRVMGQPLPTEQIYQHRSIARILQALETEAAADLALPAAQMPLAPANRFEVPVVGANGFLGVHLLAELQAQGQGVVAVVRADTLPEAHSRLVQAAQQHQVQLDFGGLEIQTLKGFLHSPDIYEKLINAAGCTQLTAPAPLLHQANLELVLQLVSHSHHLHQCSSLSVLDWNWQGTTPPLASTLKVPADAYSASKWRAEQWLEQQQVPSTLYRITRCWGTLKGGPMPEDDLALQVLKRHPEWLGKLDVLPVDVVARTLVQHVLNPQSSLLHLRSPWSLEGEIHPDAAVLESHSWSRHQQHVLQTLSTLGFDLEGQAGLLSGLCQTVQ